MYIEALRIAAHTRRAYSGHVPPSIGKHCPDCLRYMDLSRELGRLLGVKFWEVSPLGTDSEAPPDCMRHNPLQSGYGSKRGRCDASWIGARAVAETH